ncbi:MAG: 16S rRNA (cytidine(1402)-2'-O)-methyltransferase [Alphaproteobacteria bacterium]
MTSRPENSPKQSASKLPAGLYLVSVPIGNLKDITLRALEVLQAADKIACEDTRVTARLLTAHGIAPAGRLVACHDHNEAGRATQFAEMIEGGASIALVSDAGTPLVSDPGLAVVREVTARGLPITAAPGPSAAIMALSISGLPSNRFCFCGFAPVKAGALRKWLAELAPVPATLILYESPRRLSKSLPIMAELLPNRSAVVARELTKLHEEVRRGTLTDLASHYATADTPKGEVVLVISPPGANEVKPEEVDIDAALMDALSRLPIGKAASEVARANGMSRKDLYARAMQLKHGE